MSSGLNFYLIDIETSGLKVGFQEICEFSIIRAADRMQLTRQVRVEHPENSSYDALQIIKKSMNDLRQGISKVQMVKEIDQFLAEDGARPQDRCLVGHNIILFDKRWLWHYWEQQNKTFSVQLWLDTVHMFRDYLKKTGAVKTKVNLDNACNVLGIKKVGTAHTAKSDIQNTYFLWQNLNKRVDYLKHIKNLPHQLKDASEEDIMEEDCDPSI